MRKHTEIMAPTTELTEIVCNRCGKSHELAKYDVDFSEWITNEYQSFKLRFDFGSAFDGDTWEFDLCDDCLREIVGEFNYPPEGR